MKQDGGLTGISCMTSARQKFFLIASEMSGIAQNYCQEFCQLSNQDPQKHPDLQPSSVQRSHNNTKKLTETLKSHTDPFNLDESTSLFNLVTQAVVPDDVALDIAQTPGKRSDVV